MIYRPLVEETILAVAHATWRIAQSGTTLGAFNIKYISRASVKGQVLTNLGAEIAEPSSDGMIEAQHIDGKLVDTISLHVILFPEWYMLMALQMKGDLKWGWF